MNPLVQTLIVNLIVIVGIMIALWIVSLKLANASIVDPFWGMGFVIVIGVSCFLNTPMNERVTLLVVLISIWGLRLSTFLFWRNGGHGEDRRYAAMRAYHGKRFWWVSLLTVFILQALILWFVSMPLQMTAAYRVEESLNGIDYFGMAFWLVGICFESIGDWQLARFKANPANSGKVMDRGLWRYTRHPNYFGDFCVWWGIYLIAVAGGAWWTIGSPLLMSIFLLYVSGVTLLEKAIVERRPGYSEYIRRTNAFFPGPPKSK